MATANPLQRTLTLDLHKIATLYDSHRTPRSALSPRSSLRLRSSRLPILRSSLGSLESFETSNSFDDDSEISDFFGLSDEEGYPDIEDEEIAELRKELIQLREEKRKLREERKELEQNKAILYKEIEKAEMDTHKRQHHTQNSTTKSRKDTTYHQPVKIPFQRLQTFQSSLLVPTNWSSLDMSLEIKDFNTRESQTPPLAVASQVKPKSKARALTLNRSDIKKIKAEGKSKGYFDHDESQRKAPIDAPLAPRNSGTSQPISELAVACETQAQKLRLLTNVRNELFNTEREYIQNLELLSENVMKPLSAKRNFLTDEPLLSQKELLSIFGNLSFLIPVNKRFLRLLAQELNGEHMFGKAFIEISESLKVYIQYCVNQSNSTKILQDLCQSNLQIGSFINALPDVIPEFQNLGVSSFLIKPLQRICKYPLFIRELLKYTPQSHSDYHNLQQAHDEIEALIKEINEMTRQLEIQTQMTEIKAMIFFPEKLEFVLFPPSRYLIRSAEFKMIYKKQTFKGILHFFNDLLLFSKKHLFDDKYTYKAHFPLVQCIFNDLSTFKTDKKEFWFSIVNREMSQFPLELASTSATEKIEWLQLLRQHSLALLKTPPPPMKRHQSGINLSTLYHL